MGQKCSRLRSPWCCVCCRYKRRHTSSSRFRRSVITSGTNIVEEDTTEQVHVTAAQISAQQIGRNSSVEQTQADLTNTKCVAEPITTKRTVLIQRKTFLLVAAIYFGTSHLRFAFGFPGKIMEFYNNTSTFILLKPDRNLYSVGGDAEEDYANLDDEARESHYLFRLYQVKLFEDKNLSEEIKLKDVKGKELSAIEVFCAIIRYLLDKISSRVIGNYIELSEIYWLITLPASWDLKIKQIMRKAANKAGIDDIQLSFILNSEAASLYCGIAPIESSINGLKEKAAEGPDSKHLVLDLGGISLSCSKIASMGRTKKGTYDSWSLNVDRSIEISALEVSSDGGFRELRRSCVQNCGGIGVNEAFNSKILLRLFGGDVINEVKDSYYCDWLYLCNNFERRKRTFRGKESTEWVIVRLPISFVTAYHALTDCEVNDVLQSNSSLTDDLFIKLGHLYISNLMFESLFEESIDNIVKYVKDVLQEDDMGDVSTLLVVGLFAETPLVVNALRKNFPDKQIFIPKDPHLATLKGAIMYGYTYSDIESPSDN